MFLLFAYITRDELSTTAYLLDSDIGNRGIMGEFGLVVKGHITLLANSMDDLMSGSGERYKKADPQRAKMSGANKGVGKTFHPDTYVQGKSILVFDKEDWSPHVVSELGLSRNEALVDNWKITELIVPSNEVEKFKHILGKLNLNIPVRGT